MTADLVLKGGMIVDATGERTGDVAVADGRIVAVGPDLSGRVVLDCGGCVVAPGLVDLHTHLRQPGREEAETIESGSRAAALGGFTCVVAMPNTDPPIDDPAVVAEVRDLARGALCEVAVAGAITVGRAGERLAPLGEMARAGVRIFTDDGAGVQDPALMRAALEYVRPFGAVLAQHCEVDALSAGGVMHEGAWSSRLGLPGVPPEAEELMVMRDIALARSTGGRIHLQHLSTAGSVAMVRAARAGGVAVTAEVTPHHLTLTDACLATFDPVFKVNPPLRTDTDVAALRQAALDGVIDAVATDHAPHTPETKELPLDEAPPGMLGLETALAVTVEALGAPLSGVLALLSWQPAVIAGVADRHGGPVSEGRPANLCVIDPDATWTVDPDRLASRSRNTPFAGRTLRGRVRHTVLEGTPVVIDGEATR